MKTISFFLMTYKGYQVLKSFINKFGHQPISSIISERDSGILNDYYNEISDIAHQYNISFYNRKDQYKITSKYSFAISWKWILKDITNLIIFHDSCLPRYRGFAPLVNTLINGEKEIGVTALFAREQYDTGDIILQKRIPIHYPIKINDAITLITDCYIDLVIELSETILSGKKTKSFPQHEPEATYSLWLNEDDYFIDWTKNANYIKRFIDSVGYPYKCAATKMEDKVIRIIDAEEMDEVVIENRTPGKIIFIKEGCPVVVCGKGLLIIRNMIFDLTKTSLLPFKRIRVKFY